MLTRGIRVPIGTADVPTKTSANGNSRSVDKRTQIGEWGSRNHLSFDEKGLVAAALLLFRTAPNNSLEMK